MLTKRVYILVVKKVFAVMRHHLYKEVRQILRSRVNDKTVSSLQASGTSNNYLTKNELRRILEEIDIGSIRQNVFSLYGLETHAGESE